MPYLLSAWIDKPYFFLLEEHLVRIHGVKKEWEDVSRILFSRE